MSETLTRDKILDAAEDVLRRFGPGKATVLDVARALSVSHGSVYRHFADKAALRDAVVERWLAGMDGPLEAIAAEGGPVPERLGRWLRALSAMKRRRLRDDPEFFAAYCVLAADARAVVGQHVAHLLSQVTAMVCEGVSRGELDAPNAEATARGVLLAMAHFHHPAHAADWSRQEADTDAYFDDVWAIVRRGLVTNAAHQKSGDAP